MEENRCHTIIISASTFSLSLQAWIIPPDFDHSEAEAKVKFLGNTLISSTCTFQHLVFESDVDGDGHLTKEEILEKYDLFVGSQVGFFLEKRRSILTFQATDFGEALSRHDEF